MLKTVLLGVLLAVALSCAAPLQNGGVEVRPGVANRLDVMCRYQGGGVAVREVCAVPTD